MKIKPPESNIMNKGNADEIITALTPMFLGLMGAVIAIATVAYSKDISTTLAGLSACTAYGAGASGLAKSSERKNVGSVQNAENVDIKN